MNFFSLWHYISKCYSHEYCNISDKLLTTLLKVYATIYLRLAKINPRLQRYIVTVIFYFSVSRQNGSVGNVGQSGTFVFQIKVYFLHYLDISILLIHNY